VERQAPVIPSLIHYSAGGRRLLGEEVVTQGLVQHPGTFRWSKLDVLNNLTAARRVGENRITPQQAAAEVVQQVLTVALTTMTSLQDEELVVTMPVEAFNHYIDWLEDAVRGAFRGRISFIDEASACILGYLEAVRPGDIYTVFDFGGGTLDVAVVKVNPKAEGPQKCQVLGRAGDEIGGSLVDRWMFEALKEAQKLTDADIREVGTPLLFGIEDAKIRLSSGVTLAEVTQYNDATLRQIDHTFTQNELTAILKRREFFKRVGSVVKRALELARDKYGVRERDVRGVFMVGGTSLLLGVREYVETLLPDIPVQLRDPFGSIASGACRLAEHEVEAATVHDYGLEFWNRETKQFDFEIMIPKGTPFPTDGVLAAKYVGTAYDNATELNLVVWECSETVEREDGGIQIGPDGRVIVKPGGPGVRRKSRRALNEWARDFIRPDPPCGREETRRFIVGFELDADQRCLVWVKDLRPGNQSKAAMPDGRLVPLPLEGYPLVKIGGRRRSGLADADQGFESTQRLDDMVVKFKALSTSLRQPGNQVARLIRESLGEAACHALLNWNERDPITDQLRVALLYGLKQTMRQKESLLSQNLKRRFAVSVWETLETWNKQDPIPELLWPVLVYALDGIQSMPTTQGKD
jgi:actin-like ATPase involved in cell morphogenesis